jgi:hypothetical protein
MAENEILDLGGSRWKRTRVAMAAPDGSLTAIADCIAEDLTGSLRLQLFRAFQQGQTLQTVFRAAGESRAALSAVVESFCGQWLARMSRLAIQVAQSKDPSVIAQCATDMLIDACIDKASGVSGGYERFQTRTEREALSNVLRRRLDACRGEIAAVIEASLCGQGVRRQRRAKVSPTRAKVDAKGLVRRPLVVNRGSGAGNARYS